MALQPPLFPIDQPVMPETRQIGRQASIDALEKRISAAVHQWLIGPRRIGKTSVALAALARLRVDGGVALDVDLSKLEISTSDNLAGELARQARAAGAGAQPGPRVAAFAPPRQATADELDKGLAALGANEVDKALGSVAALLAGADDGSPGLGRVLDALALHARATNRRITILLDEVHRLADLDGCEAEAGRIAREVDAPIVFVLAGSEESAVRALREPGRPLGPIGQEFHLPDISTEDWLIGLRSRFAEASVTISEAQLRSIVEAAGGHPRRTMLVATSVHAAAEALTDRTPTDVAVQLAIRDAKADRAWT